MDENSNILSKEDLQQVVERAGGSIAQLMGQQNTALALLSGTTAISLTANAGILNNVLGALTIQSGVMGSQLGQQQLYDATALEGASAMYLLLSTLSGNVAAMLDHLSTLGGYGGSISEDMAKIAPLVDQMASSGGGVNDAANTAFGAVGALSSLNNMGDIGKRVKGIGDAVKGIGSAAGLVGKLGALAPLLTSAAPLLVGGLAVAGIGTMAYKAYKNHKAKKEAQAADNTTTERSVMDPVALENMENMPTKAPSLPAQGPITERSIMDPVASGNMDDMFNSRQASQMSGRQMTAADAMRQDRGDTQLIAQLSELTDVMRRVADKPADRNVKSEIVINTLKTNATLSEFKDMFNETLLRDLETVE